MERYSSYKDSGVSWIGEIPEHWEVKKIGSLFVERREKVSDKDYPPLSVSKQGITPQLDTAVKTDNGDNRKKVCKNDFVVNSRSDRKGSCGVSPYTGSVSLINIVLSPRENIKVQYFHHLFRSNNYIEEYYRIGRGIVADLWTTRYSEMRNIYVPVPTTDEQQAIVAYIEEKCQKIDAYIADKEKEIELLQELKQKTIADAVTKGLNPDAKMKDSGISWIGEIPEHWEVKRVASFLHERKEKYNGDETLGILSLLKGIGIIPYEDKGNIGNKAKEDLSTYKITRKGDVVVNCMNVIIGSSGITDYDGYISPAYYSFIPIEKNMATLYKHWLSLPQMQGAIRCMAKGILEIRLRVSSQQLLSMKIPYPPSDEQQSIVSYIEEKCQKIDKLASELQSEIDYLKEYKQRLIADCVTGQVNVSGV